MVFLGILILTILVLLIIYRFSPRKEPCRDCEALSLSEAGALPPTPHQIEHPPGIPS